MDCNATETELRIHIVLRFVSDYFKGKRILDKTRSLEWFSIPPNLNLLNQLIEVFDMSKPAPKNGVHFRFNVVRFIALRRTRNGRINITITSLNGKSHYFRIEDNDEKERIKNELEAIFGRVMGAIENYNHPNDESEEVQNELSCETIKVTEFVYGYNRYSKVFGIRPLKDEKK